MKNKVVRWIWSKLSSVQWEDAWEERFYGHEGFVIEELKGGKSIRMTLYCESEQEAKQLQEEFGGSVRELAEKNWVEQGMRSTTLKKPIMIRDCLIISLEKEESRRKTLQEQYPHKTVISIPPERAFGTGDHPTTATCLRFLVDEARRLQKKEKPWTLLDMGTGSGLLGIAGLILGAEYVHGVDYDEKAVEVAKLNVKRNLQAQEQGNILMEVGNVFELSLLEQYDLITANLFSTILVEAMPKLKSWLKPEGRLIVSGILAEQWESVEQEGQKEGLRFSIQKRKGKWMTAVGSME